MHAQEEQSELPAGTSQNAADLTPFSDMGAGFDLCFFIPFDRTEVYDELLTTAPHGPLGSSPNVEFTILRPGFESKVGAAYCPMRVLYLPPSPLCDP
jgi:hypothetical protein